MSRTIAYFVILIFLSTSVFGQNLTLEPNPTLATGTPDEIRKSEATLTNNSSSAIELTWKRFVNDIPDEWETSVCDPNLCYGADQDEPSMTFILDAGASALVYVQFNGRNQITFFPETVTYDPVPGTGTANVAFYAPSDSANFNVSGVFDADLRTTGIGDNFLESLINLFPNPVRSTLNIEAPIQANIANVEIYNIVGKKVKTNRISPVQQKSTIDLSDLQEGIYFIRLLDDDNSLITTRRINKIN